MWASSATNSNYPELFPRMPEQRNHRLGDNWLKRNAPPHLQAAVKEQEQAQRADQRAQAQADQDRREQQPQRPFYMPSLTQEQLRQHQAEFKRQQDARKAEIKRQFDEEYEQSHRQSSPRGKGKKERSRSRSRSRNPIDDALSALGIHENIASVTPQMIEHAYRKNSLSMHPDKIAQSRGRPATQAELDAFTTMGNKKEFLLELPEIKRQRSPQGQGGARKSRSRRVKRRKTRHVRRATRHRR